MRLYFYPSKIPKNKNIVNNPYVSNFIEGLAKYFLILNKDTNTNISIFDYSKYIFKMDLVIFNWIENITSRKYGFFQFIIFLFSLLILKLRKVKIVWVLHNIYPHKGKSKIAEFIKKLMFKNADLIISHSTEGFDYAYESSTKKVLFLHHPNNSIILTHKSDYKNSKYKKKYDILIWGSIEPYKGIAEFLEFYKTQKLNYKIKIVGKCSNANYETKINSLTSKLIKFDNKKISFNELNQLIQQSKYVLFPYNSASISSSGALLDSLSLNAVVIGPNKGAFSDLARLNLCFTYNSYMEIANLINSKKRIKKDIITTFVEQNNWDNFCFNVYLNIVQI